MVHAEEGSYQVIAVSGNSRATASIVIAAVQSQTIPWKVSWHLPGILCEMKVSLNQNPPAELDAHPS